MKIKVSLLRTQVEKKKSKTLKLAFKFMEDVLPQKGATEFINDQMFS